jgi:subtilisin family serine protease
MALKMCGGGGGCSSTAAITSLNYAIMMKQTYGVNIILSSNSWGGGSYNQALKDAIDASGNADMLFVASAGNGYGNNNDINPSYPGSYDSPNIIAVASTNHNDGLATHSNYGPTSVDLAAPGESVYSTVPGGYGYKTGTSMATPHVSGVAALLKAVRPDLNASGLKACILDNVDPLSSLLGKVLTDGRLNAYNTVSSCQPIECDYCLTDSYGYNWCLEVIGIDGKAYYLAGTVDVGAYTVDAMATYVYNGDRLNMTALGGSVWGDFNYNTRFTTVTGARGNWVDELGGYGSVNVDLVDCGSEAAVEPEKAGPKPGMSR